ncbi:MAG: anti-sigma factor [Pseudomonadota bacterium]
MNYPPEVIDLLAAEYVVGTLDGAARRRFEQLLRQRADARLATWEWEQRLHGLYAEIEPVRPPRSLWRRIRRQVDNRNRRPRLRPRLGYIGVSAAIAVFAFWLGGLLPGDRAAVAPERMAIFADNSSQPLWVLSIDVDTSEMVVQALGAEPLADDLIHELWVLPADRDPQSLGLLRVAPGRVERTLAPALLSVIEQSATLAISIEPAGGSPTGLPTGPVIHQASLISL